MDQAAGMLNQDIAPAGDAPLAQDAQEEKLLKQSEVNELLGKAKHAYYEKGKRDALGGMPEYTPQQGGNNLGGMPQITEDHVRQIMLDEMQKQQQMASVQNLLHNFASKMEAGKGQYQDFDETVGKLGLQNIPQIVKLATDMDNTADVMYELGKNPSKVATLLTLAYANPPLAEYQMKQLSESIKANKEAQKAPVANAPLSQTSPSTVSADSGKRSVGDLRKMPWARA